MIGLILNGAAWAGAGFVLGMVLTRRVYRSVVAELESEVKTVAKTSADWNTRWEKCHNKLWAVCAILGNMKMPTRDAKGVINGSESVLDAVRRQVKGTVHEL